jgi:Fe-S cluster biogenesis protein NfuA
LVVSTEEAQAALDSRVGQFIQAHAGDVQVVSVTDDGIVTVRFHGACIGCPALATTFVAAVQPVLEGLPGVRRVSAVGVNVSPAAIARVRAMAGVSRPVRAGDSQERSSSPLMGNV